MHALKKDIAPVLDNEGGTIRQADWGGMVIELGDVRQTMDGTPMFRGLPDDRCQCPHWGYVLKGRITYRYADHDDVYSAGEVYYAAPGHLPILEEGAEYVEFSPSDEYAKTMQVVSRNMAAAPSA